MDTLTLSQDGNLYKNLSGFNPKEIQVHSLIENLCCTFLVEENVIFDYLFRHIIREKDILSQCFSSYLGNKHLDLWIEEYNNGDTEAHEDELVFCKIFDVNEGSGDKKLLLSSYTAVSAFKNGEDISYGIDFTPISQLKNLILKTDNNARYDLCGQEYYSKRDPIFSGKDFETEFSVFDVLSGLFWDISFYGGPESRKQAEKEILETE